MSKIMHEKVFVMQSAYPLSFSLFHVMLCMHNITKNGREGGGTRYA